MLVAHSQSPAGQRRTESPSGTGRAGPRLVSGRTPTSGPSPCSTTAVGRRSSPPGNSRRQVGVAANNIAKWDGSSWATVGTGLRGTIPRVHALTVFDDGTGGGPALYAGGQFTMAGEVAVKHIAKWDGTTWSAIGQGATDVNAAVGALTVFDDGNGGGPALYAGGNFTMAGGTAANRIARWDGTTWSPLASGLAGGSMVTRSVCSMTAFDDGGGGGPALYVGGEFTLAGGIPARYIAKWDGASWSPLSGGTNFPVYSLTVFDDGIGGGPALYVGGEFTVAGTVVANRLAKWDGVSWFPANAGSDSTIQALGVFDDGSGGGPVLYAGGDFILAGGIECNYVASWDGTGWSSLGGAGLSYSHPSGPAVSAFTVFDDGNGGGTALYTGGSFKFAGGMAANHIAKWDGTSWAVLGGVGGVNSSLADLTVFDDGSGGGTALYASGNFMSAGSIAANHIAKWDGSSWSSLGSGTDRAVQAVIVFDDGSGGGPALYAGGGFTSAGGVPANLVAKWDGSSWSALGPGVGTWIYDSVNALAVFDDQSGGGPALYVAGDFTSAGGVPAKSIAKWDGTNWSALGTGMNDSIFSLTVFDDGSGGGPALYAGGIFTVAGGVPANRIAKWDGSGWSPVGRGLDSDVYDLQVFDGRYWRRTSSLRRRGVHECRRDRGELHRKVGRRDLVLAWKRDGLLCERPHDLRRRQRRRASSLRRGAFCHQCLQGQLPRKVGLSRTPIRGDVLHREDDAGVRACAHQRHRIVERYGLGRLHRRGAAGARMPRGPPALLEPARSARREFRRPRQRPAVYLRHGVAPCRSGRIWRNQSVYLRRRPVHRPEQVPHPELDGNGLQSCTGSKQSRRLPRQHGYHRQRTVLGARFDHDGSGSERRHQLVDRTVTLRVPTNAHRFDER